MSSLRVLGVSFAHTDAAPLLDDVSFHLTPGWTGLVGENGAGKTTLLHLLAARLKPTTGHLEWDPPTPVLRLCGQETEDPAEGAAAARLAERWDATAARTRKRLGLDPDRVEPWLALSPGLRKRWQIAAALVDAPDVLLLDEPTNHLDAGARARLVTALARFRGIGLLVSHDRALLEALTQATLRLHQRRITRWAGAYGQASEAWRAAEAERLETRGRRLDAARREAERARASETRRAGAERQTVARHRMRNAHDHDGRSVLAKGRAQRAEKRHARQAAVARRQAERMRERADEIAVERPRGAPVRVAFSPPPRRVLFHLEASALTAGDRTVLRDVRVTLGRGDRVHLEGPNGAGKTTLVRALLASGHRLPPDRVLFLPQVLDEVEASRALETLRAADPDLRGRILSIVADLGVDVDRLLASRRPSPGEARKLVLARGLSEAAWVLVLDEPTNHLDLPSVERLQRALVAYPGALLLVTHDAALARACTTRRWRIEAGRVVDRPRDASAGEEASGAAGAPPAGFAEPPTDA